MIYVVRCEGTGLRKIGVTKGDPESRMSTMQTGSAALLVLEFVAAGGPKEEAALHERFNAQRVRGEWFAISASDIEAVEAPRFERFGDALAEARTMAHVAVAVAGTAMGAGNEPSSPSEMDVVVELSKSGDARIAQAANKYWLHAAGRDLALVERLMKKRGTSPKTRAILDEHARHLGGRIEWGPGRE